LTNPEPPPVNPTNSGDPPGTLGEDLSPI
jgi:hypothetical protein